jgi:hypothetical protein
MVDRSRATFFEHAAWFMAYAASAVIAALVLMPIVAHPGIPAYQHDWSWPPDRGSALGGVIGHLSTWNPQGLGFPNALASANVINLLIPLPSVLVDPGIALRIALITAFASAAVGATRAAGRIMKAPAWCAVAAGFAYCTSPILLDNLGAGHIGFWFAYAMLPWALWFGFESVTASPNAPWLLGIALLGSLITIQPQFLVFGFIAALAGAFLGNARRAHLPAAAFVVGGAVSLLPVLVAIDGARSYLDLLYPHPQIGWERLLSTPWPEVVWNANYVVPYYALANAAGLPYLQLFGAIALASILVMRPLRYALAVAFLALSGMFFATGVLGPAHALWASLYAHFYPATAFRDASSGAAVISLAYALAVGASWRRTYVAAPLIVLLVAASIPFLFGATAGIARNVVLPREAGIRSIVARLPLGRIASTPFVSPIVFGNAPGGIDVDAIADGSHPSLAEYPTLPPITSIGTMRYDSPGVLNALSHMGVVGIAFRPGFSSGDLGKGRVNQEAPTASGLQVLASDGLISFARLAQTEPLTYRTLLPRGTVGVDAPVGSLPPKAASEAVEINDLRNAPVGDDPMTGWVLLTRWYALDHSLSTFGRGLVTESHKPLALDLSAGNWWLLHSGGRLSIRSVTLLRFLPAAATPRWDRLSSDGHLVLRSLDRDAAVYRFARGRAVGLPIGRYAGASASYSLTAPWRADVTAQSNAPGPWLLVFRFRYSPNWRIAGATVLWHGLAEGYANGFVLTSLPRAFFIYYQPQTLFVIACTGVWIFQFALGVLCLRSSLRRFERNVDHAPAMARVRPLPGS